MGFLDLLLGRRHASLIGLDINSSGAKLVELGQTASGEYIVERFASENFEKGWINDGTIEKFDEVAEAVQRLVQRSGTRTKQVAMAMPQSAVITKKIVLPGGLTEEEMELQVEAEAHQYIPFPLDDVSLDFCVIGPSTEQSMSFMSCNQMPPPLVKTKRGTSVPSTPVRLSWASTRLV